MFGTIYSRNVARHAEPSAQRNAAPTNVQPAKGSPLVGVLGAKGGVGATTIAINLTAALAARAGSAVLVDANLQQPSAALMLGKKAQYGLLDLVERSSESDRSIIDACSEPLSQSLPSARLICAPTDGSAALKLTLTEIAQSLSSFRSFCGAWVVDLPKNLDRHLVTMMDACDKLVLVFEPTLVASAQCRQWLSTLAELGYPEDKIVCLLNRSNSKLKAMEAEIASMPCFKDALKVPNAFDLAAESCNRGEPALFIQPRRPFAQSIQAIAQRVLETEHD